VAVVITASYGGTADNAYMTVERATEIIQTSGQFLYFDDWIAATDDQKATSLVMASGLIDGLRWYGAKFFTEQTLQFPRIPPGVAWPWGGYDPKAAPDENYYTYIENDIDQRHMKQRVEIATALTAMHVLELGGEFAMRDIYYDGRTSYARGQRFSDSSSFRDVPSPIPPRAWDQLRYYRSHGPRLARG